MKNIIYRKFICSNADGWDKTFVTLTEEANRLIVWNEGFVGEEVELMVIKTFPEYQRNEAIEFAVQCAAESIFDAKAGKP